MSSGYVITSLFVWEVLLFWCGAGARLFLSTTSNNVGERDRFCQLLSGKAYGEAVGAFITTEMWEGEEGEINVSWELATQGSRCPKLSAACPTA